MQDNNQKTKRQVSAFFQPNFLHITESSPKSQLAKHVFRSAESQYFKHVVSVIQHNLRDLFLKLVNAPS